MKSILLILSFTLVVNTFAQDTIVTKDNQRILARKIVRKNVPTEDPAKWVKGMYYTNVKGERVNIKDENVVRIIMKKLPVNKNNMVVFTSKFSFKNSPKNKIYDKLKIWIADTWKNANEVIQVDNKEGGSVLLKGLSNILITSEENKLWYTIEFKIQDNKLIYIFKNISTETYATYSQYGTIPAKSESAETYNFYISIFEMTTTDMEKYANNLSKRLSKTIKKAYRSEKYKKHYKEGVDKIENHITSIIHSVNTKMKELDSEEYTMSSDEALSELKKWKEKYDLELITKEEYDKKKTELSKLIK